MFSPTLLKKSLSGNRSIRRTVELTCCACQRSLHVIPSYYAGTPADPSSLETKAIHAVILSSFLLAGGVFYYSKAEKTKLETTTADVVAAPLTTDEIPRETPPPPTDETTTTTTLLNWSGTHAVTVHNQNYYEPETIEEVESIVRHCHQIGQPLRPLGSALSPNGIAFSPDGMISMANLDQIVHVDPEHMTVTVQAGARVSQVVDALRPYGLTLPNLASIAEQQMGGFVQVGAHGTGARIAPVDHYVTKLKLVTPGRGTIELCPEENNDELFHLAKVGLGCLGVVVEVTMQCIPAHSLVEHTFVLTRFQAIQQVNDLLQAHRHVRFMWIPYQDAVVVVTNDPEDQAPIDTPRTFLSFDEAHRFQPLRDLLAELTQDAIVPFTEESMSGMGFGELRDALLAIDPLNVEHIKKCNQAEAEFWKRSEGYQTKPSDQLLQFDCGGQQWVWEVCFPTGTQEQSNGNDMDFMERLLQGIERLGIPAPSPIEQRWTAASSSLMSPAHGTANEMFSWVGIINYLPTDDEGQRRDITNHFKGSYCDLMRDVGFTMNAASHWAKLERPESVWKILDLQLFLQSRYPVTKFNQARAALDPNNIMASPLINLILGKPGTKS